MSWQTKKAFEAVHILLSLSTGHCADHWRVRDLRRAQELFAEMHVEVTDDLDDLRQTFVRLRKSGTLPAMLKPVTA